MNKNSIITVLFIIGITCMMSIFSTNPMDLLIGSGNGDRIPQDIEGIYEQNQGLYVRANYYDSSSDGIKIYIETNIYPKEINVSIILNVEYKKIQQRYIPIYHLNYKGEFLFSNPANTTIFFPIPLGTITDLTAEVNHNAINKPDVTYNHLKVNLTDENSTFSISFNSEGTQKYSHEVPKHTFIEEFKFLILINNASRSDFNIDSSLSPDEAIPNGKSVSLVWSNANAIMRQDIVIEFSEKIEKTPENFLKFFTSLIYGLLIIGIVTGAFYLESLKRIEHQKRAENSILLLLPYFLLCISLGTLGFWIGLNETMIFSFGSFAVLSFYIDKKALEIKSGILQFFLIPLFLLLFLVGFVMKNNIEGAFMMIISSLLLILLITSFFLNHPRPKTEAVFSSTDKKRKKSNKIKKTPKNKVDMITSAEEGSLMDKNFCPFCSSIIEVDFGFCPKCGQDICSIVKCKKCGFLGNLTSEELYCPNCGSGLKK